MGKPYTQRFILFGGGGGQAAYTVPPGYRAVVRSFTTYNSGTTLNSCALWLGGHPVVALTPGANSGAAIACHIVAYGGEDLTVTYDPSSSSGSVAGYIFVDPEGPIGKQSEPDVPLPLPAAA